MTFTKEQLQQIIDTDHVQCGDASALARMALAGVEAEPVAYIFKHPAGKLFWALTDESNKGQSDVMPVFTAPQPLTTSERAELENYRSAQQVAPSYGRDQFEEWFKFHHGDEHSIVMLQRANGGANYIDPYVDLAWISWKDSRAAMLQGKAPQQLGGPGGVHAKVNNGHHVGAGDGSYGRAGDDLKSRGMGGSGCDNTAPQQKSKCWFRTCRPVMMTDMRFVVCPDCGNKRCPRANDCSNACTGSNAPGQDGSAYPAAPKEVL